VSHEDDKVKDMRRWFARRTAEAQDLSTKKARFDEFSRKLNEAMAPFRKKEADLLAEKRKTNVNVTLTDEEREAIWRPFRGTSRRIEDEVYGDAP
jgi:hypothetical protein